MYAAPQAPALRHVAGLAADSLFRLRAGLPLREGVFKQFTVECVAIRFKLMTGGTETGALKRILSLPARMGLVGVLLTQGAWEGGNALLLCGP